MVGPQRLQLAGGEIRGSLCPDSRTPGSPGCGQWVGPARPHAGPARSPREFAGCRESPHSGQDRAGVRRKPLRLRQGVLPGFAERPATGVADCRLETDAHAALARFEELVAQLPKVTPTTHPAAAELDQLSFQGLESTPHSHTPLPPPGLISPILPRRRLSSGQRSRAGVAVALCSGASCTASQGEGSPNRSWLHGGAAATGPRLPRNWRGGGGAGWASRCGRAAKRGSGPASEERNPREAGAAHPVLVQTDRAHYPCRCPAIVAMRRRWPLACHFMGTAADRLVTTGEMAMARLAPQLWWCYTSPWWRKLGLSGIGHR